MVDKVYVVVCKSAFVLQGRALLLPLTDMLAEFKDSVVVVGGGIGGLGAALGLQRV